MFTGAYERIICNQCTNMLLFIFFVRQPTHGEESDQMVQPSNNRRVIWYVIFNQSYTLWLLCFLQHYIPIQVMANSIVSSLYLMSEGWYRSRYFSLDLVNIATRRFKTNKGSVGAAEKSSRLLEYLLVDPWSLIETICKSYSSISCPSLLTWRVLHIFMAAREEDSFLALHQPTPSWTWSPRCLILLHDTGITMWLPSRSGSLRLVYVIPRLASIALLLLLLRCTVCVTPSNMQLERAILLLVGAEK